VLAVEISSGCPAEQLLTPPTSIAMGSSANVPQVYQLYNVENTSEEASGGSEASLAADHLSSAVVLKDVVFAEAQELARNCQVPGISEAAEAVCTMVLAMGDRENYRVGLQRCRAIGRTLKQAAKVLDKVRWQDFGRYILGCVRANIFSLAEPIFLCAW